MKLKRKLMGLTLAVCMAAALFPAEASAAGTDTGKAIQLVEDGSAANIIGEQGSNVYYGTYLQSKKQDGSGYNTDPIKWRVLSNEKGTQPDEGDKLFLLADRNLDVVRYNMAPVPITWEKSTIRSWLNDGTSGFLNSAFSEAEQGAIPKTRIENKDNGSTDGGENTDDFIFLLSLDEVQTEAYGFPTNTYSDTARVAYNTDYVVDGGQLSDYNGGNMQTTSFGWEWWLRSPGNIEY